MVISVKLVLPKLILPLEFTYNMLVIILSSTSSLLISSLKTTATIIIKAKLCHEGGSSEIK